MILGCIEAHTAHAKIIAQYPKIQSIRNMRAIILDVLGYIPHRVAIPILGAWKAT